MSISVDTGRVVLVMRGQVQYLEPYEALRIADALVDHAEAATTTTREDHQ
jgi:hypothetical protein